MHRSIPLVLSLVALVGTAEARDPYKVAIPTGSPLQEAPQPNPRSPFARFKGEATILVKYRFIFEEQQSYGENPYLLLLPSKDSLPLLPYLMQRGFPEKATEIFVINPREAAQSILGEKLAAEALAGKHQEITGAARLVIGALEAGYECDAPSFGARFVRVEQLITAAASVPFQGKHGC